MNFASPLMATADSPSVLPERTTITTVDQSVPNTYHPFQPQAPCNDLERLRMQGFSAPRKIPWTARPVETRVFMALSSPLALAEDDFMDEDEDEFLDEEEFSDEDEDDEDSSSDDSSVPSLASNSSDEDNEELHHKALQTRSSSSRLNAPALTAAQPQPLSQMLAPQRRTMCTPEYAFNYRLRGKLEGCGGLHLRQTRAKKSTSLLISHLHKVAAAAHKACFTLGEQSTRCVTLSFYTLPIANSSAVCFYLLPPIVSFPSMSFRLTLFWHPEV